MKRGEWKGDKSNYAEESGRNIGLIPGEAVAIGMVVASQLAERLGRVDAELTVRQRTLLTQLGLPVALPALDPAVLLAAMRLDKKAAHGRLRFVLPARMGHVELVSDVPEEHVLAVLQGVA